MSHTCKVCKGEGKKTCPRCGGAKTMSSGETCYYCKGEGKVECDICKGSGEVED